MNTLTDLRRTLDQHAEDVADPAAVARTASVHHRIAAVRRRRLAVGAGAAALVVVAGVATIVGPRTSDALPAAPVVLGQKAPTTQKALGYTYRTDGRGYTFSRSGGIDVHTDSRPQLFSWTTETPTTVRLVLPNGEIWSSDTNHFRDFVVVPPGQKGTLRVSVPRGQVALASYRIGDSLPAGYTKDGVTFRQTVATADLLGAVISDQGQIDASATFVAPRGDVALHLSCVGLPDGDSVHVSFNGSERTSGACNDATTFDPGGSWGTRFQTKHPGRPIVLRVWATAGDDSSTPLPAGSAPDLRMYAATYGPVDHERVGGYQSDRYLEHGGHLWTVRATSGDSVPAGQVVTFRPTGVQGPAVMAWNTRGMTSVRFDADGMAPQTTTTDGGQASIGDLWVPRGATVRYGLTRGTGRFGIALYQRAD